jgi:Asp-tRNA(Asn)/Glu-tRNA(Gln) amidotransferase A subunit family amidase
MTSPNRLSAAEAARRIAAGKLSSEELIGACAERIRERDSDVQAWVHFDADAALAQARAVDKTGGNGMLAGIPVGFKDVIDTVDMPTQYNSAIYRGYRPRTDAACGALVRRAGGVVLGKTVTTEFASRIPGPTRNPHNLAHSPGGSSSGSAAAVADFMVPLAFGTQTGGSTIRPAAYCGIVGYKPSFGTINRAGLKALAESLDTIGVMARTVEDCALLVHTVSGRVMPKFEHAVSPPRIGLHRTSRWNDCAPAARRALEDAAAALASRGARVREIDFPAEFDRLYDDQNEIMYFEASRALMPEYLAHRDLLSGHMQKMIGTYSKHSRADYSAAMQRARACRARFSDLLSDIDVLLTLSAPGEAPEGIAETGSSLFNRNWTLLGAPCVTIPAGRGPKALPLAVQFVGAYDDDERVLRCAHWAANMLA